MTAASELNFSQPGSAFADHPVQITTLSKPTENSNDVAANLNRLEMLSQFTRPGIAFYMAQQETLYCEHHHGQLYWEHHHGNTLSVLGTQLSKRHCIGNTTFY